MEKIVAINEVLKNCVSVDIFNDNSYQNDLSEKICKKIYKYFLYELSLQEIVKNVYGNDAEIVIRENVISDVLSNIENLDLNNPNTDRILCLDDLGYKVVESNYYVKCSKEKELIYIGTNKNIVNKYNHVVTEIGFMNILEQTFNIELIPNTEHSEIFYEKKLVYPPYYGVITNRPGYVPLSYDSVPFESTVKDVIIKNIIKTKDGNIIAKMIDCKHFDGYSTDKFIPDKVKLEFNFKKDNLVCDLINIPNDVLTVIKKTLRDYFYNYEEDIIKDILEILKGYINENINSLKDAFLKELSNIHCSYCTIADRCSILKVNIPNLNYNTLETVKNMFIENKKNTFLKYDNEMAKIGSDLRNVGIEKDNLIYEVNEVLKGANDYWEILCYKETEIFAIDDEEEYKILVFQYLKELYLAFLSFFNQENIVTAEQIEELKDKIEDVKQEINYGRSFEKIYCKDYCSLSDNDLPFDDAEYLADFIHKQIDDNNNLVNEIIGKEKLYIEIENRLETVNENYENEKNYIEISYIISII